MKVEPMHVTVRELAQGYTDAAEAGVTAYGGDLDVRPPYQREFVYHDSQRDEVVRTVLKGLPLNVMYWVDRGEGSRPRYEVMDGQQRTISVCSYVAGGYGIDGRFFFNLPTDVKDRILDYRLTVYVCSGTQSEKLDWFRIINIAGVELTDQEMLNAVYAGPWVSDARARFSRPGGPAVEVGGDYMKGSPIRQDWLAGARLGGRTARRVRRGVHRRPSARPDGPGAVELLPRRDRLGPRHVPPLPPRDEGPAVGAMVRREPRPPRPGPGEA